MTDPFPSGNYGEPFLRVRGTGHGGSGYKIPTWVRDGKPATIPGVTTVLGVIEKPAIRQWAVDQTAAYASANIDALLNRTATEGFGFLRFYHKRKPDLSDPVRSYHQGVLDDAAELGTAIHKFIEYDLAGLPLPVIDSAEMDEMVGAWQDFKWEHSVKPLMIEATVVNRELGYAGTLDLLAEVDGVPSIVDIKSARNTWPEHWAQQAALGACYDVMTEVSKGDGVRYERTLNGEKTVTYWAEQPLPAFSQYRLLHVRPSDYDSHGEPLEPFCRLIDPVEESVDIDEHFDLFVGALAVVEAQKKIRNRAKG